MAKFSFSALFRRHFALIGAIAALMGLIVLAAVYGIGSPERNNIADSRLPDQLRGIDAFEWFEAPKKPTEAVRFLDEEGNPISLSDFEGQVVLLNIWATWCTPCVAELPSLDQLAQSFAGQPFEVVAVSIDRQSGDDPAAFFERLEIESLALYRDPSARIGFQLGAPGYPVSYLFDRQGREIGILKGDADWAGPKALRLIQKIIDQPDAK